jgi:hypothetical protein
MAGSASVRTVEQSQGFEQGKASEEASAMDNQGSYQRGDIRVSDAERDQAVAELGEHFQAGRLTQEEFDDRSGRALQARTGHDLSGLFGDLPRPAAPDPWSGLVAAPMAGPVPRPGGRGAGPLPAVRFVLSMVIVAIIAGNVLGHAHDASWLVPVFILGFILLRLTRIRR